MRLVIRRHHFLFLAFALATSFGIHAETVDGLDDTFGEALARHTADPTPSVLVARTPTPLVPPPNTSPNWYRRT